jgi:amino-acid N-acetyltransferase
VDRGSLPLKAWKDCLRCPKFQCCDEIAVLKALRDDPVVDAGPHIESMLVQLPQVRR